MVDIDYTLNQIGQRWSPCGVSSFCSNHKKWKSLVHIEGTDRHAYQKKTVKQINYNCTNSVYLYKWYFVRKTKILGKIVRLAKKPKMSMISLDLDNANKSLSIRYYLFLVKKPCKDTETKCSFVLIIFRVE